MLTEENENRERAGVGRERELTVEIFVLQSESVLDTEHH